MNKLSVLFIASGRDVGLSFNLTRLAIALKHFGHRVIVISEPGEEEKGLREELRLRGIRYYAFRGLDFLSVKNTISAARIMGKIVDHYCIDLIHAQGVRQLIAAFLCSRFFCHRKVSLVASTHSTLAETPYQSATLLIESFVQNICADLAIPVAKSVAKKLVRFGLIPNKVKPIYNGIDLKLMDETMYGDESFYSLPGDFKQSSLILIGYFARLVPKKGHVNLIEAISELSKVFPNTRLIIAGDGPLRRQLEFFSKRLNIEKKILFTGKIEHKAVYELLNKIHIYVFPSLAELFPYAILEAMAARKPIVATKVGGIMEIIENGKTGILVQPGNREELAKGIEEFINNPTKAKQMGENCRRLIEARFALSKVAHCLTRSYEFSLERKFSRSRMEAIGCTHSMEAK